MPQKINTAKDPKPTSERIQQLATRVLTGDIALPEFQRPFVWKRKQILDLLDSIYRNFPIGSMLVWESKQDLASKRTIADLQINERSETYPINYLLDGQQRLSTICGVLHWSPGNPKSVWNVIFDLKTSKFSYLDHIDGLPPHQIPLRNLSNPSLYYRRLVNLENDELSAKADILFNRFTDYQVPLVTLGDMSVKDVAPVFERINSTGTRLTIFDLMRAATWSPDFDLGRTVATISSALEPKKFSNLDSKTFLRALAAAGRSDFSAESIDALRELSLTDLQDAAQATKEAAEHAADFLSTEVGVPRAEALPYANQFAVLCEIYRLTPTPSASQLTEIRQWFWRTTLTSYFGGWDNGQMSADAQAVRAWALAPENGLKATSVMPTAQVWRIKTFRSNSAISKMTGLMLASQQPVDLINGAKIDIGKSLSWSNDKEYHHFFPQAYLRGKNGPSSNLIANIVLLTSASNITIRDAAPKDYLTRIIKTDGRDVLLQRLKKSMVSEEALDAALNNDYESFLSARASTLHAEALRLVGDSITIDEEVSTVQSDSIDDGADTDIDPMD